MRQFGEAPAGGGVNVSAMQEILLTMQDENKRLRKDNFKLAEKIRKVESGNFDEFFTYSTSNTTLAISGTATLTVSITREADFYLTKIVARTVLSDAATGEFRFLIRDSSNDRQWSNIALANVLGAGTATLPLILPKPRFIARASTITIELTNMNTTLTNDVQLGLIGYKVYHVEDLNITPG